MNCLVINHVYFATPPIPRRCINLDSVGKFSYRASKINAWFRLVISGVDDEMDADFAHLT